MVTEDEMDITLKKLRGRKYYEEKEFGLPIRLVLVRANQKAGKLLAQNLEILSSHKRKISERMKRIKSRIVT